ncbi:MAG: hypothetical protein JKY54_05465 [Flavobacteriales bacterium]|nr:hypothetical protein [Flavobacteriales bacterium]
MEKENSLETNLNLFKKLSILISRSKGEDVKLDGKRWTSLEYFGLLGKLKQDFDNAGKENEEINYLYNKYKVNIPA